MLPARDDDDDDDERSLTINGMCFGTFQRKNDDIQLKLIYFVRDGRNLDTYCCNC